MNPRVLVLILASDTDPLYCAFQIMWREYMNLNPNIRAYFYKGHPDITQPAFLSDDNTLLVKIHDNSETLYEKTFRAFEYFSGDLDKYDFVFRTNLSSFVYFPYYLEFCKSLPKTDCCAAVVGIYDNGLEFPSGAGVTLSPDIVKRIIKERPQFEVPEDVVIGCALQKWGIPIINTQRLDILTEELFMKLDSINTENKDIFHIRLKNIEGKRQLDIRSYLKLLKIYYKIG
jgi:hypothetical protein